MTVEQGARTCPQCGTPRVGNFRYCQSCAFDYDIDLHRPASRAAVWPEEVLDEAERRAALTAAGQPPAPAVMIAEPPTPEPTTAIAEPPTPEPTTAIAEPATPEPTTAIAEPAPGTAEPPARVAEQPSRPPVAPPLDQPPLVAPTAPRAVIEPAAPPVPVQPIERPSSARAAFQRPVIRTETGQRFRRTGRWAIYAVGGVAILATLMVLTASFLLLRQAGEAASASPSSSDGLGSASATQGASPSLSAIAGSERIVINEPENGSRIESPSVTFRGTGPVGEQLVHDAASGNDTVTTIGGDGAWTLEVPLTPGPNQITLRLGDDPATELTWTVTSVTATSAVPGDVAFDPITLRGTGNQVASFSIPEEAVAIAEISHQGSGPFAVWTLDENDNQTDQLVNARGNYEGRRLFDAETHAVGFRVETAGQWSIVVRPVSSAERWDGSGTLEGTGSDVFLLDPPATSFRSATIRHTGPGAFTVVGYSPEGRDDHANTVGEYFGESLLREGTTILAIEAGGSWTIVLD